jgi:hypothetical protein
VAPDLFARRSEFAFHVIPFESVDFK